MNSAEYRVLNIIYNWIVQNTEFERIFKWKVQNTEFEI